MKDKIKKSFIHHLTRSLAKREDKASEHDRYMALALTVRDLMVEKWIATKGHYEDTDPKTIYYISLEYLMGRAMGNAMINLGVIEAADEAMREMGYDVDLIRDEEVDAGLGNGGLGRLAACFLDSMATMELSAKGFGLRYDYGIFKQLIENGYQVEEPDNWLRRGNPWEIIRPERARVIRFHGHTEPSHDSAKPYKRHWRGAESVLAMPYDTPIPGYDTNTVNTLRLWSARSLFGFNLESFNRGDYINANLEKSMTENITKVLYPNDNNYEGKELRLRQQYFMVSASLQDILADYLHQGDDIRNLHAKVAIQLNDTHPAMAVPELMRLLVDIHDLKWEEAWSICTKTFSYTNHTLMSEALERWPVSLMEALLPRHMEVIYEINARFLRQVANAHPGDTRRLRDMSIIEESGEKKVRMAYLAVIASAKVNGVAALHTELLKSGLFSDFHEFYPDKFVNVTNGITPRRWLRKANLGLSRLISSRIGDGWVKDLGQLKSLEEFAADHDFLSDLGAVKRANKAALAKYVMETQGVALDVDSIFDVQVKRLHEYKRQLLNILHAVSLYLELKDNPDAEFTPRAVMFGAKAAPGYYLAKMIIKLINAVGSVINNDPAVNDKLKVLFLPNYRVSLAEIIIPAADLSEQISLAGTEASGTGNMKFALNGALTIGTMDGANVEIHEAVGADNIFIFGMSVDEVRELRSGGYNPGDFIDRSPLLRRSLELIGTDFFSQGEQGIFQSLLRSLESDFYMVAGDFDSYRCCQRMVAAEFLDRQLWSRKSLMNIANMGRFSSDRTIAEYARGIWGVEPCPAPSALTARRRAKKLGIAVAESV